MEYSIADRVVAARKAAEAEDWDEAESQARRLRWMSPTNLDAMAVLAAAATERGDTLEAVRLYRQAIACEPRFTGAYAKLARLYYNLNRLADAERTYQEWLRTDPKSAEARHMIAALTGLGIPTRCSDLYVQTHFDDFASSFDDVLVRGLSYCGPVIVDRVLDKHLNGRHAQLRILDAGCGTGLCGPVLKRFSGVLTGVDLSEQMLRLARNRNVYDALARAELTSFLRQEPMAFDAIVSCDVFIYFGSIRELLAAAFTSLASEGLLVATVEALHDSAGSDFRLGESGRYSHRKDYVLRELAEARFELLEISEEYLRWELGKRVLFYVFSARKSQPA